MFKKKTYTVYNNIVHLDKCMFSDKTLFFVVFMRNKVILGQRQILYIVHIVWKKLKKFIKFHFSTFYSKSNYLIIIHFILI